MVIERQKANSKQSNLIILASGSPRRTQLLDEYNISHEVIPSKAEEISFHEDGPLSLVMENAKIKASDVLKFRDQAFDTYFKSPDYLNMISKTYGSKTVDHINDMTKKTIKRKHNFEEVDY